ncbi:hypothetical protein [Methylobacter sp.]|jgi:predicted transcriptional regulator|uniref:hypothetical protein n=1 Tax=Methylobacter sp. TaxID=2051955 RepID=UPI003DA2D660
MSKKIIDLKKARNKKKQSSIDEIAEVAARRIFDNIPDDLKEPEALASGGDMSKILEEDSDEEKDK